MDKTAIAETDTLRVTCDVTNVGSRKGKAVAQLYVRDIESSVRRPIRELKGFEKVELAPGETKIVSFTLDKRAFAYYETRCHDWFVECGEFAIEIGENCRDIRASVNIHVQSSQGLPMAIHANTNPDGKDLTRVPQKKEGPFDGAFLFDRQIVLTGTVGLPAMAGILAWRVGFLLNLIRRGGPAGKEFIQQLGELLLFLLGQGSKIRCVLGFSLPVELLYILPAGIGQGQKNLTLVNRVLLPAQQAFMLQLCRDFAHGAGLDIQLVLKVFLTHGAVKIQNPQNPSLGLAFAMTTPQLLSAANQLYVQPLLGVHLRAVLLPVHSVHILFL